MRFYQDAIQRARFKRGSIADPEPAFHVDVRKDASFPVQAHQGKSFPDPALPYLFGVETLRIEGRQGLALARKIPSFDPSNLDLP